MKNPFKEYKRRKIRKQQELAKRELYNTCFRCPESTILWNPDCMNFYAGHEDRVYVEIGERCIIGAEFRFESLQGRVKIGSNTHIGDAKFICHTAITVGNDVTMAWGITLYDHDSHSTDWEYRKHDNEQCYSDYMTTGCIVTNKDWSHVKTAPIVIEDKVWIGMDVLVLNGVTIGEGSVVAARSVVTRDVPPYSLVAGNPARVIKSLK